MMHLGLPGTGEVAVQALLRDVTPEVRQLEGCGRRGARRWQQLRSGGDAVHQPQRLGFRRRGLAGKLKLPVRGSNANGPRLRPASRILARHQRG